MRVFGICAYPVEAAATRFRLAQFVEPLRARGIEIDVRPFLDSARFSKLYSNRRIRTSISLLPPLIDRVADMYRARKYDVLFVQREAMNFGPAVFEWLFQRLHHVPMILDLDDATYVSYVSPTFGRLGSALKFFGKTDNLIRRSSVVVCGNRLIAEYVGSKNVPTVVIPTLVDTDLFRPGEKNNAVPVIGWIGTHSTFPFLEMLFPVLSKLGEKYRFVLKIVGSGQQNISIPNVKVETVRWHRDREVRDFQSLDIGLYPIFPSPSASDAWLHGKSGFKAIEYMAAGVPFVMSPVGICAEIGETGVTHLLANGPDDWYEPLVRLIEDTEFRMKMGRNARNYSLDNYPLESAVETLEALFRQVAKT